MATPPDQVSLQQEQEQVQPGEMTPVGQGVQLDPAVLDQKVIHMNAKRSNPLSYPIVDDDLADDLADDATS